MKTPVADPYAPPRSVPPQDAGLARIASTQRVLVLACVPVLASLLVWNQMPHGPGRVVVSLATSLAAILLGVVGIRLAQALDGGRSAAGFGVLMITCALFVPSCTFVVASLLNWRAMKRLRAGGRSIGFFGAKVKLK